jgi:hypothetical protein
VDIGIWNVNDEYLGFSRFEIGELVGSKDNTLSLDVFGGIMGVSRQEFENSKILDEMK